MGYLTVPLRLIPWLTAPVLGGCMAAALVPAASLITGTLDNSVTVSVDDKSISPELRSAFSSASTIAVVAGDRSSIKAADVLEIQGGYIVTIDRPTAKNGEMTGSERRDALRRLCATLQNDVAILGHVTKTGSNNTGIAALTGRAKEKDDWTLDIMACRTTSLYSINGTIEFDVGIYNAKQAEMEDAVGTELGTKIVASLGKSNRVSTTASRISEIAQPNPVVIPIRKPVAMSVFSVQTRLVELGYLSSKPDGKFGPRTAAALKRFQFESKVPVTGQIDSPTVNALMPTN